MMFRVFAVVSLTLAAVSSVTARAVPRATPPPGWAFGYLEDYNVYHARYLALNCESQHSQPFFNSCCHPMLATETLAANRKPECVPSSGAYSSAMAAESSVIKLPINGGDCSGDLSSSTSYATPPPHSSTSASSYSIPSPDTSVPSSSYSTPPPKSSTLAAPKPPHTSTSSTAKPAPSSGGLGQLFYGGFGTFFYQNGNAGACGAYHSDSDLIVAMDQVRYGNSGVPSPLCGKQVQITNQNNGKSVVATVADDCPTCTNSNSIDLSLGAFTKIATVAEGEVSIVWRFL